MSYKSFGSLKGHDNPMAGRQNNMNNSYEYQTRNEENIMHKSESEVSTKRIKVYHPGSQEERDHIISNNPYVVIDHYAEWCKPCKHIQPEYEMLSTQYPNIKFLSIDIDDKQEWKYSQPITGVPAFHFYCKGQYISDMHMVGASKDELRSKVDSLSKM